MSFEVRSDTTVGEPFRVAYDRTEELLSQIAELRQDVAPHERGIPGTALDIAFSGSRIDDTDAWHDRTRIEVIVPALGPRKRLPLLERTITIAYEARVKEPYAVNAWRGIEGRGDFMLTRNPDNKTYNVSIGETGYYDTGQVPEHPQLLDPKRDLIDIILRGDQSIWVPEVTKLTELPSNERLRFKLAASRVLEMAGAVDALLSGEDTFDVLDSLRYLLPRKQARQLHDAKEAAVKA